MKKYKLLKDTPTFKAGTIFEHPDDSDRFFFRASKDCVAIPIFREKDIDNFNEWFKEVKEPKEYFYLSTDGDVMVGFERIDEEDVLAKGRKSIGNYFETREQAEKALARRKVEVILRKDTKGFVPDWDNRKHKYYIQYDCFEGELDWNSSNYCNRGVIYFESKQDAEESIKRHEKEWKIYLGVE